MSTAFTERTTAKKTSRTGVTYSTTWNGKETGRFTFWPFAGGFRSIAYYGARPVIEFHATRRACMEACAEVVDPEQNGRYIQDNDRSAA